MAECKTCIGRTVELCIKLKCGCPQSQSAKKTITEQAYTHHLEDKIDSEEDKLNNDMEQETMEEAFKREET